MTSIKDLDSTAIYAYTTLISVLICVPAAAIFEGPHLRAAAEKASAAHPDFYMSLFLVGLLYHLYNQVRPFLPTPGVPAGEAQSRASTMSASIDSPLSPATPVCCPALKVLRISTAIFANRVH